ncbi:MAG: AMP-binding protein, partial [Tannerellaceae bacterium]|nr:AMP-binding protein [Tannerellaceae bacterium]
MNYKRYDLLVKQKRGDRYYKSFSSWDELVTLLFGIYLRCDSMGETCAIGEQGELCCRGYLVMKGYYKKPEATAEVIDANGWLHSGDLGIKDVNGNYRITGRIKDMIIRGGENIYPREI